MKAVEKEVIFWTPVVIADRFPLQVVRRKVEYRTNRSLNNQQFPRASEIKVAKPHILRLPMENIDGYLKGQLAFELMLSDDELIQYLERLLH